MTEVNDETLVESLQAHYGTVAGKAAQAATAVQECCGSVTQVQGCGGSSVDECDTRFGSGLYDPGELAGLPVEAVAGSIGCANPVALARLELGEDVLDLGSGGGIDVLLSARRVGPEGKAYGVDMTAEMLELARANQARAGVSNVEFLEGRIEEVPLPAASVDVVVSNCVINLSADKAAVFGEAFRLLRPGGRLAVADVVADVEPDPALRADKAAWAGCIAGAVTRARYSAGLMDAGFMDVEILDDHPVGDGFWSVFVRARKP